MKVLWAVRDGNEAWQEEIISTDEVAFEPAKAWAIGKGFRKFRISEALDGEKPDFVKAISK